MSMGLTRRDKIARTLLIWTAIASVALVLAGCLRVVGGHAVMAGDKGDALVINPGGPGESGIDAALGVVQSLPKSVRERFDLVGFDPRGVGMSRPAIWCNSDADNDRLRTEPNVDYSPAGVKPIEGETKGFVGRCVDQLGNTFLANVGTVNVARDLDAIRAALGDDKLTYLGYSYGTRIGSAYAEAFPQKVRARVLDGADGP